MDHAWKLKYSLHYINYAEGIVVIFQGLSILFVRSHHKLTMKIGLRFFWLKFEFLWFFKVLDIFLVFSKIGGEGITPGTRGILAE